MHLAAFSNERAVVQMLLAAGADLNARLRSAADMPASGQSRYDGQGPFATDGAYPIHLAVINDIGRDAAGRPSRARGMVALLLAAGADPEARMDSGATPLHLAAQHNDSMVAAVLLAAGADPDARDTQDLRPLHYAAVTDAPAVATDLLAAGADPEARTLYRETPVELARRHKAAGMLALLRSCCTQ